MSGRRSPHRSLARIVVLALLALAMATAPALSFAAEAHEAVDHPAAHDGGHGDARHDRADGGEPGDDGARVLHLVTQLGICCGHACALLPADWSPAIQPAPAQPDARIDILTAGRRPEHPLRPPIDA